MAARMTLKDFIEKSQQMHNNKYDYSKSVYINNSSKIAIICPEHGEFLQRASSHMQGQGCPVCAHDLRAKTCLNRYGVAQPMMTEENRLKASESVKNKYGVDNVFQSEIIKNKIAQTNLEHFGVENPMQNADIKNKAQQTNIEKYGVSCSMRNENVKAKHRASVKTHYGVENSMQSPEVQVKCRKTFIAKYGVENPRQNAEINEKIKNTCLKKYGVSYAIMSVETRKKAIKTLIARYGVKNPMQDITIRNKSRQTNLTRYGSENPMSSLDIQQKQQASMLDKYGVNYPLQSSDIRNKVIETSMEHYGVKNPMQNEDVQNSVKQTNLERYGAENPMHNLDIQQKCIDTIFTRYGVKYPAQNADIMSKILKSKRENGTFNTSKPEETLYDVLCNVFGENDVIRQHSSDLYPFACDFYIKSRDLYIELNASWTHGGHFYNAEQDVDIIKNWQSKSVTSVYYENALTVWTVRDVEKRNTAKNNNLNYITFWDNELRDAELWFAMNCPDGKDYDKKYSWLPERVINNINYPKPKLTGTHSNLSAIAKSYNFDIFYENEINLWNENLDYKNLTLQAFLYYNRLKYIGKLPNELSNIAILRAFTIAGIRKGYTVFDTSLMNMIATKYNIKSVCDPCAGWGERMLYCYHNNIAYHGIDINAKLQKGYNNMITDFNMTEQVIETADSALCNISGNYDAVITCPPYGNIEIYSENGSENLDNNAFLDWWHQVVLNCDKTGIKYFCFQINQKYRDSMLKIVENCNYKLIDELQFNNNKSSHFTRKCENNIKKEFETMLVLQKI